MEQKLIKDMSTSEMVAEYNELTGKSIKKFSARKIGELQLQKARDAKKAAEDSQNKENYKKETGMEQNQTEQTNETKPPQLKRSIATSNSWNDKAIAERRAKRNGVKVEGFEGSFYSVKSAFEQLGLNIKRHIVFRGLLKKQGDAVYQEDGKEYKFSLIELTEYQEQKKEEKKKSKAKEKETKAADAQPETLAA